MDQPLNWNNGPNYDPYPLYPPGLYPNPPNNPHPQPIHHYPPFPPPPPLWNTHHPAHFAPDHTGWWFHPYWHMPPPGLPPPVPKPITPVSPVASTSSESLVHDFWKGRFAPLPGFSSRPGLLPLRENRPLTIRDPTERLRVQPDTRLLPPGYITPTSSPLKSPRRSPVDPSPNGSPISQKASSSGPSDKHPSRPQPFEFDKYAEPFVPQYLKDIQKQPHNLSPLPSVPVFPPSSYLQSFLFPHLIEKTQNSTILSSPPATESLSLCAETYADHWTTLLSWELDNLAVNKEQIVLWKIGIKIMNWEEAEFALFIPGIRENHPRLEIGDLVHLREVLELRQTGSGWAFEARVVNLRKRDGYVHIRSSTLKVHISNIVKPPDLESTLPTLFNVSFLTSARPTLVMETAITVMDSALKADVGKHNLARRWLFPEPEDLTAPFSVLSISTRFEDKDWVDKGLNAEQKLAASSIALHHSPVPYLISGPPGTGKTRTIAETVLQILRVQQESCILLCAPSNPATDTLILRLRPFLQPQEMLRLNDQNRTFAEIPNTILPYCYIENDKFALPPWKKLMQYRVVVCSCLDAGILAAAQCTNSALLSLEKEVMQSLHPHRQSKHHVTPHWTHLLIDEAAQGSEPELLIPISVVFAQITAPPTQDGTTAMFMPQLVLCGDPNQLGPIVSSDEARNQELDVSLLERLFERPLYAEHLHARSRKHVPRLSEVYDFVPFTNLVKNYRSHPGILMPPSAIFYNDSLEPHATNGVIRWTELRNPELPLMFFGHEFSENSDSPDDKATWFNHGEIDKIVQIISSLLREGEKSTPPLKPAHIGVMAPWRVQVWKLRERLRNEKLSAVDVGTVEDYQGRESRIVIISCVRSNYRFLKRDKEKGLGFIFEKKRMNVAITRAKELLVIVGNGSILKQDPYWKGFLQFTLRNRLYIGPELGLEMDGNYISRLESNYINAKTSTDDEEQGIAIAGGVARDVLEGG